MEAYSIGQLIIQVLTHKMNNFLMEIILPSKIYRTTDSENQLPLPVISHMSHFISSVRTALCAHCFHVYLVKTFFLLVTNLAVDGQEDGFCPSYVILMTRNNTKVFYITQTDIRFSITKAVFYNDSKH